MRLLLIATGDIALPTLRQLLSSEHELLALVTQPDKPAGRRQQLTPPPVKTLAASHGIPVLQPPRIRAPEAVAQIEPLHPDAIVVMAYGQILPDALLRAAPHCINLHASLLPRHRGAAPIHAAIEAGDRASGITVMHVTAALDSGDIILEKSIPLHRRETAGTLHDRLADLAPQALTEALPLLDRRSPQDDTRATYAPKLNREYGRLDWTRPHLELERKIRAMNPWPAASTTLYGKTLKLFTTLRSPRTGPPGEILRADRRGILVACGTGSLLLHELQLEGSRRMPARDFLRGHPLPAGTRLG